LNKFLRKKEGMLSEPGRKRVHPPVHSFYLKRIGFEVIH